MFSRSDSSANFTILFSRYYIDGSLHIMYDKIACILMPNIRHFHGSKHAQIKGGYVLRNTRTKENNYSA